MDEDLAYAKVLDHIGDIVLKVTDRLKTDDSNEITQAKSELSKCYTMLKVLEPVPDIIVDEHSQLISAFESWLSKIRNSNQMEVAKGIFDISTKIGDKLVDKRKHS